MASNRPVFFVCHQIVSRTILCSIHDITFF